MINVFEICDEIVTTISAFKTTVIERELKVDRGYHFVQGNTIPKEQVNVTVYPMARAKTSSGATKEIVATCYAVIKAKILPTEKELLDQLVKFGTELDEHLEGQPMCGAKYVMTEDDQFYWFPDELHERNHFSSLLELQYRWRDKVGGNPTT